MSAPVTFLVASPHLRGSLFEGTVILLLEHDTKGAMGLIVNAPMTQSVQELMPELAGHPEVAWLGGPVDPTLGWCLYAQPVDMEGELRLLPGLTVSSSLDVLRAVERSGQPFMLVLGYAGWGAGQLTEEAREGTWVWVEQSTPELLWDVPAEERWQSALDRLGVDASRIVPGGAQA
ncbi:YqgE/AlgH family protein [Deinococcus daejeonensis]|nr:YqgE/AlgH family protein [Deinococcus daejeonensis]